VAISALWAKKTKEGLYWLPLLAHLTDTAEIARLLWDEWLPGSTKRIIADSLGGNEWEARKLLVFLSAAHDIGKATPVFQAKRSYPQNELDFMIYNNLIADGLIVRERREEYRSYQSSPHALASQMLLQYAKDIGLSDTSLNRNAAVILGTHHGKPPDTDDVDLLYAFPTNLGIHDNAWNQVQSELIQIILEYSDYETLSEVPAPLIPGQVLLSSLVIIADWIASNYSNMPLVSLDFPEDIDSVKRARCAWNKLSLPAAWDPFMRRNDPDLYTARFGDDFLPNPMQKATYHAVIDIQKPGIMIIEAPMGSGKTEAALVAAELFRNRTMGGGLFFALPTQATSDGIFPRLLKWMELLELTEQQSVRLAHSKAQFNKDFSDLYLFPGESDIANNDESETNTDDDATVIAHQWFNGRKKTLLANFVVGTIDQLLLMALMQKHVMLRHLGLAGKVVIIDECHAYDAYMSHYLMMALSWLGAYKVPVIVLSATLPMETRRKVIGAYLGEDSITGDWAKSQAYPLITYSDGIEIKTSVVEMRSEERVIRIERLAFDAVEDVLEDLLSDGGCAGVIMDTVRRAQKMACRLKKRFRDDCVLLIHSRFITPDRFEKEEKLRKWLGKNGNRPAKLIVVGTQVLEQSLDIDFDVLVSDIAPMDLLLQRLGRLQRHARSRKNKMLQPRCYVTGIDDAGFQSGIDAVYDIYFLKRTLDLLDDLDYQISLPGDIARLVNAAYDPNAPQTPEKANWERKIREKETKADAFRMVKPMKKPDKTILSWLNTDVDEKYGEASVRDSDDSVEVIVIKRKSNGFCMINGTGLPGTALDASLARELACQSLSLPRELSNMKAIEELRAITNKYVAFWQESHWIAGELFLIFDEDNSTTLCGHKLLYTNEYGLQIEREKQ